MLNCASIVRHARIDDARLHVLTSAIADADGFRSFLVGSGHAALFSSIEWHRDLDAALGTLDPETYDSLFVEDDRLGTYLRVVPYRTRRLVVFEEGIGTYRNNPVLALRGLRRVKWKVLAATRGCGWEFGEGRLTDVVMVVHPVAFGRLKPHLAHKTRRFPGLIDELRHEHDAWHAVVEPALCVPPGPLGDVALVLATWGGAAPQVLSRATEHADLVFYKPHPHDSAGTERHDVVQISGSWIPAEAIVEHLAGRADRLTVYHSSSSVGLYARGLHANVTLVDVIDAPHAREVLAALDG